MLKAALLAVATLVSHLPIQAQKPAKAPAQAPAQTPAMNVDQIVQHHLQALGGAQAFNALKSLRITGKVAAGGMEMPTIIEIKKPLKFRSETFAMGQSIIQVVNGKDSWMINPMMGSSEPTPMPAEMISQTEDQASQFEGPLVHYKERGCTLELLGKEKVDGADAYKLKLVDKNAQERILCLDAGSYLISKLSAKVKAQGQEMSVTIKMGDYKAIGGILFAHTIDIQIEGMPMTQRMTMDKIEVNPVIEDSRFEMPKKAPAPAVTPSPAKP